MRIAWSASAIVLLGSLAAPRAAWPASPSQLTFRTSPGHAVPRSAGEGQNSATPTGNIPAPPAGVAQDIDTLRQLEANYLRAEMENSATLAQSIMADDYLGVKSDGGTVSKQDVLDSLSMRQHGSEPYHITATNMREHVLGDMAVVTYTKVYTLPSTGATYSENLLHIFTKRNGIWHLQVSSPVPTPRVQRPAKP